MVSIPATVRLPPQSKAFNEPEWIREHEERAYFERKSGMAPLRVLGATGLPRVGVVEEEWGALIEAMFNGWDGHFLPVNLGSTTNGFQQLI